MSSKVYVFSKETGKVYFCPTGRDFVSFWLDPLQARGKSLEELIELFNYSSERFIAVQEVSSIA